MSVFECFFEASLNSPYALLTFFANKTESYKVHAPTNALYINLDKVLNFYFKNHFDLLLHVSVYDHHQGAFIRA